MTSGSARDVGYALNSARGKCWKWAKIWMRGEYGLLRLPENKIVASAGYANYIALILRYAHGEVNR